ncbi:MAG: NIPSNAP family protein [Acidimicrobiales bacterium]
MAAVIEFRTYTAQPGERAAVIELLEDRFFAEMERLGIKVLGCYPSLEDETTFVWLRAFPDAAAHEQLAKELYGGALWKEELEQPIRSRIAGLSVSTVEDTTGLWDAWPSTTS